MSDPPGKTGDRPATPVVDDDYADDFDANAQLLTEDRQPILTFAEPKFDDEMWDILEEESAVVPDSGSPVEETVVDDAAGADTSTPAEPTVEESAPKYTPSFLTQPVCGVQPGRGSNKPHQSFSGLCKYFGQDKAAFRDTVEPVVWPILSDFEKGLATIAERIVPCQLSTVEDILTDPSRRVAITSLDAKNHD